MMLGGSRPSMSTSTAIEMIFKEPWLKLSWHLLSTHYLLTATRPLWKLKWSSLKCGGTSRLNKWSLMSDSWSKMSSLNLWMPAGPCMMRLAQYMRIWLTIWWLVTTSFSKNSALNLQLAGKLIPLVTLIPMQDSLLKWALMLGSSLDLTARTNREE